MGRELNRNNITIIAAKPHVHWLLLWVGHFLIQSLLSIFQKAQGKYSHTYVSTIRNLKITFCHICFRFFLFKKVTDEVIYISWIPFFPLSLCIFSTIFMLYSISTTGDFFRFLFYFLKSSFISSNVWLQNLLLLINLVHCTYQLWTCYYIYSFVLFIVRCLLTIRLQKK